MTENQHDGIAIIGLTGRFPGAADVDEFWRNLVAGVESLSTFTDAELAAAGLDPVEVAKLPDYVRARGVLQDADCFDAAFFGMNPKEAEATDPQQRAFLEAAWAALESAGYVPDQYRGAIGLFAGMTNNTYYLHNLHERRDVTQLVGWLTTMMGNEKDYLATRVAYKLNLKGPALNVYTACSTSLVAVCQAVQSLQNFQCDMALAGGVSITFPQARGYQFQEGGITSPDGHCRAFDANAAGTVFSHGLGIVVLKRLAEAVADGDHIYAVIKGAALNNDGSNKVSFTAPSVDGQAEVIALAQAVAGVDPDTISYIEAHGTGTPLGDPIEVAALTQAFRAKTGRKNFCGLGTVKSNFGHLDAAAGVTGLIKTALALKHRQLPPSLHFTQPNPKLELETSPFYVVKQLTDWKRDGSPLRAGVSSFGVGGTNAHVVLEEAPELDASSVSRAAQLILLSAKSLESLEAATTNLAAHFKAHPETSLADAAFTLQVGRAVFGHRRILVGRSAAEVAAVLESRDSKKSFSGQTEAVDPPVVFMFPGQGAQYVNMGREIYDSEPAFKADVDRCAEILKPLLADGSADLPIGSTPLPPPDRSGDRRSGLDLRDVLFPTADKVAWAEEQLIQTRITQPALFVIEYALAKLWMSWGVKPAAMIGHSVGEYVAACLAGVFTLAEGLELVAGRARLVQAMPPGAMLSVRLPEADLRPLLGSELSLAAINSPALCVVSGPPAAVEKLGRELEAKQVMVRRLHTSHAFHSAMMDPVLAPFTELLKRISFRAPRIPYVSNVTAQWVTDAQATSPHYWAGHVRQAVRFGDGVGELLKHPQHVLLEVGPGQTLAQLARQHPARGANQTVLSSLATAKERGMELNSLLTTLGRLWLAGMQPDWNSFYANERRHRVGLPTYAFEKRRYWVEPGAGEIIPWASPPAGQAIGGGAALRAAAEPAVNGAQEVSVDSQEAATRRLTEPRSDAGLPRQERILKLLTTQLSELSGMDAAKLNPTASFLELGFDSLFLTQASLAFQNRYGVKITFRQLLEDLPTLADLAAYLDQKLAADALPTAAAAVAPTAKSSTGIQISPPAEAAPGGQKYFGPFKPIDVGPQGGLTERQQKHLAALITRYINRTPGSKRVTQEHRARFADPRAAAGFKHLWKEMVYPIVAARSQGAKIWDVDGNEYIDITLGFGLGLLGHKPPFVVKAIEEQLALGMEIGPSSPLAGKVAELMCEFSGQERVTFCNTGSEAVTAALRISRTVSGRNKVAMFTGSYHGIFDEVLVRPQIVNGELHSTPIAPGIAPDMVNNMIVLEYGSDQALEVLRTHGHEIAAVLVEPVQSRRPDFQPREFLHELRRVTEQTGTALIFDETVTGFRCHPGGAQAVFGVKADISTYGKVVGGGLPIGVCCGRAKYMDALDGGKWQYGDESFPEVGVTFFAGTFVRHPLALAAALAVLTHLKEQGPQLQEALNRRAGNMCDELDAHFKSVGVPIRLARFSSMYYVTVAPELKYASLLFYHLREKGLHIWEGRPSFLSVAHTEEDLARIVSAFKASVAELQAGGFFPDAARAADETAVTLPLTETQEEMWLAAELGEDASRAMNDTTVIRLRGELNVELLRATLQMLVDRHDALRTTFARDGSEQRIQPRLDFNWTLTDLTHHDAPERERLLTEIQARSDQAAFDLERGPLFRVGLVKLTGTESALVFTAHHSVVDGWSVGVLLHELSLVYSARSEGRAAPLEPALAYRDYAEWQHGPGYRAAAQAAEAYWLKRFADGPASVDLPTDRPRPPQRTFDASRQSLRIEAGLYTTLKQAARRQGCTPLTYLLGGFKVWLRRLTGREDLIVGIPAAGQIAAEAQALPGHRALVGHCVNLLPIRSRCDGGMTFAQYLGALRRLTLDAYEHQSITFGTLVKQVKLARDPGRVPLVSVTFNVDRAYSGFRLSGLATEVSAPAKGFTVFDLGINIVDYDTEMRIDCRYNRNLFEAATVQRWLADWLEILRSLATNPDQLIAPKPRLGDAERQKVLVDWNQTAADFPREKCLHQLFEEQAARTPDAVALHCEGRTMTYGELNRRANQLAHHLAARGAGPENLVAVLLDRSFDLLVALLGILKAGAAFVPLDPAYPRERLLFMLGDTRARWLLTQDSLAGRVAGVGVEVIQRDPDWPVISGQPAVNPPPRATAQNLAYVIYTSGSTGQPKGVMIEHRSIVNHLVARQREFPVDARDRFLQKASASFDIAVWEMFAPLVAGAQSVLATTEGQRDSGYLARLMAEQSVTVAHFGPALMQLIVSDPAFEKCVRLRQLFCGGEPLSARLQREIFSRSRAELISQYGPTETTVDVTWCRCDRDQLADPAAIGRPIANTQAYVLDAELQPVPVGEPGELHIGGVALARGYLNRPELTAKSFVANPFDPTPGARLYQTGDVCRQRTDGTIEFLGRADQQVKLRGHRVELGEIESVLQQCPELEQAVVAVRRPAPDDPRLVGYVKWRAGAGNGGIDLRAFLLARLPEHMVPAQFVPLADFPLTPTGKIDRRALPEPAAAHPAAAAYVAPRTEVEAMLAGVWAEVLALPRVGVEDDFFALGGHSLLAARVVARIRRDYQLEFSLGQFLRHATIAALAGEIENRLLAEVSGLSEAEARRQLDEAR